MIPYADHIAALAAEFERGIQEGQSKQAILELHGREKFLKELKTENKRKIELLNNKIDLWAKYYWTADKDNEELRAENTELLKEIERLKAERYNQQVLENIDLLTKGQQDMSSEYNKVGDG